MSEDQRLKTIQGLRRKGWSYQKIADKIGMSKSAIIDTIKRHAGPPPKRRNNSTAKLPGDTTEIKLVDEKW